ncbi:hypothetical protein [Sphingobium sp. HWE2-09]|uniref:hypothetical protein n=1 Tax=Sphingobium sp. HWE2-09 TaxID=3108390 RepID=UPI00403EB640
MALLMPCAALVAQTPSAVPAATANLEGVWQIATPTGSLKPVAGAIPFTAEGRKAYERNKGLKARKDYDAYDIATSRCSTPGVPRLMLTPKRFKIWQQQNVVTFDFEWNRAIRQIDVRGLSVDPPVVPNMTGVSKGHWEGDSLVATTSDVSERTLIDDLVPHSIDMKVTERIRLVDANTLEDRVTIADPVNFTQPWTSVITYKRQPDAAFPEDVCMDRIAKHQSAFAS